MLNQVRDRLNRLPRRWKSLALVGFDAVALVAVLWLSYQLRLGGSFEPTAPQWILMEPLKFESSGGATLTPQPDGSLLVSGANPPQDVYTITARIPRRDITAVRIEALPQRLAAAKEPPGESS